MVKTFKINIAGLERELQVCKVNEDLCIAAFILFGDVEMTVVCSERLLSLAPPFDIILTAEAKGIPLAHEMAKQNGNTDYIVARKAIKVYMKDVFTIEVQSMTTREKQSLHIDGNEAQRMAGKRVLIVDDVISTGESVNALEFLVKEAGGIVAGKMAVLAEGDARNREDIIYLEYLPLLDMDGIPLGDMSDTISVDDTTNESMNYFVREVEIDAQMKEAYAQGSLFWDKVGKIDELNIIIGLGNVNGQSEIYGNLLREIIFEFEESVNKLDTFLEAEDMEAFHQEVQILKMSLEFIGATELSALAFDLAIASASEDEMFCIEQLPGFLIDLQSLTDKLAECFTQ